MHSAHIICQLGGGGGCDPSGLTLGLAPIGPVDICMPNYFFIFLNKIKMSASIRDGPRPPNT